MFSAIKQWLPAFRTDNRKRIVICGSDSAHYGLLQRLRSHCDVLALVTTEPWQHGIRLDNVPLRYPSEVPSLYRRLSIDYLVIATEDDRLEIERATADDAHWQPQWRVGESLLEELGAGDRRR
jgi:FlaA1/EpsC-like NDP-sugar epimerase